MAYSSAVRPSRDGDGFCLVAVEDVLPGFAGQCGQNIEEKMILAAAEVPQGAVYDVEDAGWVVIFLTAAKHRRNETWQIAVAIRLLEYELHACILRFLEQIEIPQHIIAVVTVRKPGLRLLVRLGIAFVLRVRCVLGIEGQDSIRQRRQWAIEWADKPLVLRSFFANDHRGRQDGLVTPSARTRCPGPQF